VRQRSEWFALQMHNHRPVRSCASHRFRAAIAISFRWCKLDQDPMGRFAPANRLDCVGTWLSLVEHSLGVRGVGSSNLPVPTIKIIYLRKRLRFRF
jgi:hypothetical protein